MPMSNEERQNLIELVTFLLDQLDIVGRPANAVRQLPPLNDQRLDTYVAAVEAHWADLLAEGGFDLGVDPTVYDAHPQWQVSLDYLNGLIDLLSTGRGVAWHSADTRDGRVSRLARLVVLVLALAVALTGGPP